jgi:hypothetical protein
VNEPKSEIRASEIMHIEQKFYEGRSLSMRFGELADIDFAGARGKRVGAQAVEVQGLRFVKDWRFARQD